METQQVQQQRPTKWICNLCFTIKYSEDIMIEHLVEYHHIDRAIVKIFNRMRGLLYERTTI